LVLLFLISILVVQPFLVVNAAAGNLDSTFGSGGKVITDFKGGDDVARAIAIQPDGKIVAVGERHGSGVSLLAVSRYNVDGSLDSSFDGDGKLIWDLNNGDIYSEVAIQGDGKIIIGGTCSCDAPRDQLLVIRLTGDGSLDTTFNEKGYVTTGFGTHNDAFLQGLAIQPDGKILVGGYKDYDSYHGDFILVRYNIDGRLDAGFGSGGKVVTNIINDDKGFGLALQGDGKIVMVGRSGYRPNQDFIVARYNSNGSLDTSFSGDGIVTTDIAGTNDYATDVIIQPEGEIVVTGGSVGGGIERIAVVRYNRNGSLDTSFDSDGKTTLSVGSGNSYAFEGAIQQDGSLVLAGYVIQADGDRDFAIVRLLSNGSLDNSFSGDGIQTTDVRGFSDYGYSIAIQDDGKIIVGGESVNYKNDGDFALVRYKGLDIPGKPRLISPSGIIGDRTPSYMWNKVSMASHYRVSVYSINNSRYVFQRDVAAVNYCSSVYCTYTPPISLIQGNYKFKVNGFNLIGMGPTSEWMKFTISKPVAPTLISPNGTIGDKTPTYKWNAVSSAKKYKLYVYSYSSNGLVVEKEIKASDVCSGGICKYTHPTALSQGEFRFKVNAYNPIGWGSASAWMKFRYGKPAAPVLISPSGVIADTTPTYKWNASDGAKRYKLVVYSHTTSSTVIIANLLSSAVCSGGLCSYTPATALSAGKYHFTVRAYNKAGWGPSSAWKVFDVLTNPPVAPTLITPSGVIGDSTPTYKWNKVATATKYRLSVYSVTTSSYVLTLNVTASSACFGGVCKYTSSTPLAQGEYRFKVKAYNVVGWGTVSSWMNFRYGTPAAPVLISPSGTISDTTPTYTWNESDGAIRYKLMVYSIGSGSNVLTMNLHKSGICSGGVCSHTQPTTLSAGDYRFKVRAYNKAGWGPVSMWKWFTVSP
jgi:uncharacterized delta-60 repeat protein